MLKEEAGRRISVQHREYHYPCLDCSTSPNKNPTYLSRFWCWIGSKYEAERIAGEYFWLWACALISIVLYLILFFRLRGNIDVDPDDWKRVSLTKIFVFSLGVSS